MKVSWKKKEKKKRQLYLRLKKMYHFFIEVSLASWQSFIRRASDFIH